MTKMKFHETVTVICGFIFVCFKAFVTSSGYKHIIDSGVTLLLIIVAFVIQESVQASQTDLLRAWDPGLWVCLLLPSVANGVEIEDRCLLRTLVLVSLVSYVSRAEYTLSTIWRGFILTIYMCLTVDLLYHKPLDAVLIAGCCMVYTYLLYYIPVWFKKSFTFGEACLVLQLYVCQSFREVRTVIAGSNLDPLEKAEIVVFVGLHIAVLCLYFLENKQCPPLLLWPTIVSVGLVYLLIACVFYLTLVDIDRLLQAVILTSKSAVLLCWWSMWLVSSVLLVCFHGNKHSEKLYKKSSKHSFENLAEECSTYDTVNTKSLHEEMVADRSQEVMAADVPSRKIMSTDVPSQEKMAAEVPSQEKIAANEKYRQIHLTETDRKKLTCDKFQNRKKLKYKVQGVDDAVSVRKYFHVAIICVYIPGLILNPNLLYLASIVVAAVLIFFEVIRVLKVEPFGSILNKYLWVFLDVQDSGDLILTPIYLLIGCSLPVWWNYRLQKAPCSLSMYSGLISVGIGDGTASVIGRKYGRHKWPGSKKSVEGTSAAILSQVIAIQILSFLDIPGAVVSMETVLCVILISLLEAFTNQIDNLVVPVFAWVLLATVEPTY